MQMVEKILVRAPNWIGDAVMCLPALTALKSRFEASEVHVLVKPRVSPVFANNPAVTRIIEFDDKGAHRGFAGRLALAKELKKAGFSRAVLFQNAFEAAFLAFMARIPERAGYDRDLRSSLLTVHVKLTDEILAAHQTRYYLNIALALGADINGDLVPRIYLTDEERASAKRFVDEQIGIGRRLVCACPGAAYGPAKRWMPGRFAGVLKHFSERHDLYPVIMGGPDDTYACEETRRAFGPGCLDIAGKLSLRSSAALLAHADLFITNDSGPMHMGSALGVPMVAVFGSTDPVATGPLSSSSIVVQKKQACAPCFERTCRYGHYECLGSIGAEDVIAAGESLLAKGRT